MKEFAKSFYNSALWQKCRASYISDRLLRDGGLCEECGDAPGYIVHHITELTPENITDPEITLNHDNLEYVCKECHDRFEGHFLNCGRRPLPVCRFGPDGQPVPKRRKFD